VPSFVQTQEMIYENTEAPKSFGETRDRRLPWAALRQKGARRHSRTNMTNLRTKPRPFTLASEAAGPICDSANRRMAEVGKVVCSVDRVVK
jgi:hypothetical protein